MKIKCIIVDDEPLAIDLLRVYVNKTSFLELVACCNNAIEALDVIHEQPVDLLFLDIQMPELTGIDFSRTLQNNHKVIFTTAYKQYAFEGFKVNAIDYLLKPISYAEFLQAANKALQWFNITPQKSENDCLFVKSGHRYVQIDLNKVLYIENQKDYVKIHIEDEPEPVTSLLSMKVLEEKLPLQMFMRVHRSFIVHLDKIKTVERNFIVFGKQYIPISDSYKENFSDFLSTRFLS